MNNFSTFNNEDFLAECTTNVFSLTDTRGLKWKKYACKCLNSASTSDDPILTAYTIALKTDVFCVWQRIPQPGVPIQEIDNRLFNCAKELVIFWYGEEPALKNVPGPQLQEVETGSYEDGISPENLDLFFKSIYNIIEKNLLNGDFVRLGKWFTKPVIDVDKSNTPARALAFSFSLFIHGESTVVAAVDVEEKNAIRNLCPEDGQKTSVYVSNKESKVLLAPYGLDAHLTGNSLPNTDARAVKIIEEWKKFFPISKKDYDSSLKSHTCCGVVEVSLGEVKMLYPAHLVLVPLPLTNGGTTKTSSINEAITKTSKRILSTKVVNKAWENIKQKEELHLPSTQLWDFKENCYHSACGCSSNSNTTRVKSSTTGNPFSNTFNHNQGSNANLPSTAKVKKVSQSASYSSFHQRALKTGRPTGRLTPSLSGRVTPLPSGSMKPFGTHTSTGSEDQKCTPFVTEKKENIASLQNNDNEKLYSSIPNNLVAPALSKREKTTLPRDPVKCSVKKNMFVYKLPEKLNMERPQLPGNNIEPRFRETVCETAQDAILVKSEYGALTPVFLDEPNELKIEQVPGSGIKKHVDPVFGFEDVGFKKIKSEPSDPPKRGPGRPRGRRSSVLSPSEGVGQISDDDIFLPNTRRRSSVNLRKRDSPITSPRSESPTHSGPGRPRKRTRISSKNLSTTKPPPSPPYKSTSSVSIMTTKELMPNFDDLDHMFDNPDDDDDDISLKKIPAVSEPLITAGLADSGPQLTTSNLTTTTATGLTVQDLAQMFPTPPSPPKNTTSPITMTHSDHHPAHANSVSLVSPDTSQHTPAAESEQMEIEKPSLKGMVPTFILPKFQVQTIPSVYAPIVLPQRKVDFGQINQVKYTPSWDANHHPPILSRRPSGNRVSSSSVDAQEMNQNNSKLKLTIPSPSALLQRQISELATPSSSTIPITMQDYQALIINLTIADSCINWTAANTSLASLFQEKTYMLFNAYQNLTWKKTAIDDVTSTLFPEDSVLQPLSCFKQKTSSKALNKVEEAKFLLLPNDIELLLKNISTPLATKYLHGIVTKYYTKQPKESEKTSNLTQQSNTILKELQRRLEKALHSPVQKSVWDDPKVNGPLSFKKLTDLCNKNNSQSALSANGLLFNYDGDMLATSPVAVKHWQSLNLEPYGGRRNIAYIVALPESEFIVNSTKQFFKELNCVYESLNLGTHWPIVKDLRDGLLRITQKSVQKVSASSVSDWFSQNDSKLMAKLKVVAQFCKHQLGPYLASLTLDSTLYTSKSEIERSASSAAISSALKQQNPSSPATAAGSSYSSQNTSSVGNTGTATVYDETPVDTTKDCPPTLVIYMVDPFHQESQEEDVSKLWSYVGLLKCFVEMSPNFDKLKDNILLQVIPLEQILQLNLNTSSNNSGTHNSELKELALSVYSRCRGNPMTWIKKTDKCMTGFGVCNYRDNLVRRRQVENNLPPYVYLPPFILSIPTEYLKNQTHSSVANSALQLKESNVNTLFCCYGISNDDQWLVVTCTDQAGELHETSLIKITYPKRRSKKSSIWSIALRKLWEFITGVISYSVSSWRVILSKLGDVGHMELRELQTLIQKEIQAAVPCTPNSRPMSPPVDVCAPCAANQRRTGQATVKSISLCTINLQSDIKLLPIKRQRNLDIIKSRVFVMPSPKSHSTRAPSKNSNFHGYENSSLMNTSFDDDSDRDTLHGMLPMFPSPSDASIFQTSPPSEITKLLSPPYQANAPMPSLSPFQPIPNKQMFMASPTKNVQISDSSEYKGRLAIGFLLSGTAVEADTESNGTPQVIKSELHVHVTSNQQSMKNGHPLDSKNYLEVMKFILERFDMLSWLNVDPATGSRRSCLPVHARTSLTTQEILRALTT